MPDVLDRIDRQLLQIIQVEIPLVERPFAALGARLGIDEEQVLARMVKLAETDGPIRQISAVFDSRALGYESVLAAGEYDSDRIEVAAAVICRHPGVSHCYQRDHRYNLWYTLTIPPASRLGLDRTLAKLDVLSGAVVTRKFPAIRSFKIEVNLDMTGQREPTSASAPSGRSAENGRIAQRLPVPPEEMPMLRALQEDLSIEPRPFDRLAAAAGCSVRQLLDAARRMIERGQMRRYAAVLRHYQAGFVANGMVCWRVPEERIDPVGRTMATFNAVSHCYLRSICDDWPFNLYTMIHGRSREECLAVVDALTSATGIADYRVLWSVREFKKARVRYFSGDIDAWETRHAE